MTSTNAVVVTSTTTAISESGIGVNAATAVCSAHHGPDDVRDPAVQGQKAPIACVVRPRAEAY